ncbi:MAG: hypothetical protein ACFFCW_29000 [Candidatus Hodarchaeota archaeon]
MVAKLLYIAIEVVASSQDGLGGPCIFERGQQTDEDQLPARHATQACGLQGWTQGADRHC